MNQNNRRGGILGFFINRSVTTKLILFTSLISVIGFFFFAAYPSYGDYFFLKGSNILNGKYLWTLLTHIFFHANLIHLFVNMFSLYFIGSFSEMIIGGKRLLRFYLIAGIFAGMIFVASAFLGDLSGLTRVLGSESIYAVGASGALFGLLGILAVVVPKKRVVLIAGPLIVIILQIILNPFLPQGISYGFDMILNIIIFAMIFAMFSMNPRIRKLAVPAEMPLWIAPIVAIVPLVVISFFIEMPIGNTAHFGGLLIGLLYGYYLRNKYKKKIALLERVFR